MKKTLLAAAVMAASSVAFAASNVTLYGVIEEGVLLEKAKHADTTVQLRSGFDQGGRWGIKGVEDLGNGYSVGFILEQGFTADDGNVANSGNGTTSGFTREAFMYVNGDFSKIMSLVRCMEQAERYLFPSFITRRILKTLLPKKISSIRLYMSIFRSMLLR